MTKAQNRRDKPTVAIVGAGRLGQALALALQSSGYAIVALVARHRAKAEKAARLFSEVSARPEALGANRLGRLPLASLIIIATPDDAISDTAEKLSNLWPGKTGAIILHTSGALSSEVLAPLKERGFQTGSIHPLASISDPVTGAEALRGAFYCLEGTKKAEAAAKAIVRDLAGRSFSIKPGNKALYHAAAVMASPHLTALFDLAIEMLASCGLSKSQAQRIFIPLLESTVNNLKVSTPQQSLTGTFARGDIATVRRHLQALAGKDMEEAAEVYRLLGLHSLELAKNKVKHERIHEIRTLIDPRSRSMRSRRKDKARGGANEVSGTPGSNKKRNQPA